MPGEVRRGEGGKKGQAHAETGGSGVSYKYTQLSNAHLGEEEEEDLLRSDVKLQRQHSTRAVCPCSSEFTCHKSCCQGVKPNTEHSIRCDDRLRSMKTHTYGIQLIRIHGILF